MLKPTRFTAHTMNFFDINFQSFSIMDLELAELEILCLWIFISVSQQWNEKFQLFFQGNQFDIKSISIHAWLHDW